MIMSRTLISCFSQNDMTSLKNLSQSDSFILWSKLLAVETNDIAFKIFGFLHFKSLQRSWVIANISPTRCEKKTQDVRISQTLLASP